MIKGFQYFCRKCGASRDGLLDESTDGRKLDGSQGYGFGYSWNCPKCGSGDIDSDAVEE